MRHKTSQAVRTKLHKTRVDLLVEGPMRLADHSLKITLDNREFSIPLKGSNRDWRAISDANLVDLAKAFCKEHKIIKKRQLEMLSNGLYWALIHRTLINQVFKYTNTIDYEFDGQIISIPLDKKRKRSWKKLSDDEIVSFAKLFCKHNRISAKKEIEDKDNGLYLVLLRRKLIAKVFDLKDSKSVVLGNKTFVIPINANGHEDWISINREDILKYARAFCKEHNITKTSELQNKDNGLLIALRRKKLVSSVFEHKETETVILDEKTFTIPLTTNGKRNLEKLSNDTLIKFALAFCKEHKVSTRSELSGKDSNLCAELRKRKLLNEVLAYEKFDTIVLGGNSFTIPLNSAGRREWQVMSDFKFVAFARAYCTEHKITGRHELEKKDGSLYQTLRNRHLLDQVFVHLGRIRDSVSLAELASALETFGGSEK